ncbi:MAG: signal peptide peptidase SppA [Sphingobacteriales bacterium]|nr:MAG: signal peptide peptidase SppA [Sphingobacteriales bacterium]
MLAFFRTLLACIVAIFVTFFLIIFLVAGFAAASGNKVEVKNNSVLVMNLDHDIPERTIDNPFMNIPGLSDEMDQPVSLKDILSNVKAASKDDKIKGIYMNMSMVQAGYPTLEEIRNALIDFKKSGKFIYAYSELYTQKSYYLASVADSIYLNPNGVFSFAGFHSEQIFFKGLLDKLEIEPKLIRAGKYKAAGETFINTGMSAPNREQLTAFINSSYNDYLAKIAASRKVSVEDLRNIADNLLVKFPEDAVKYKLIDKVVYEDQVLDVLKKKTDKKENEAYEDMPIEKYVHAEHKNIEVTGKDKIALIYAVGDIMGGDGDENQIGSDKLAKTIREAREDDKVKAIVLRINSPGGSALASDIIWREVILAKAKKPVVASFGDVAASGGYYIAAPADMIFAQPNTITGSIGVFGLIPILKDFWNNKLGINFDRVTTGKYADLGNPNRKMTAEEEAIIQQYIDKTYTEFKQRVADGRKLPIERVDSLAQGRIYSGIQAKEIGLVDQLGSLQDAIDAAAKRAKLDTYSIKVMPKYKQNFSKAFRNMVMVKEDMVKEELGPQNYYMYKKAKSIEQMQGILMYYPYELNIY